VRLLDIEAIWLQEHTHVPDLEPVLAAGQRLGACHVLVVGADSHEPRLLQNFQSLCELAARYGMGVSLEFITYCSIGSLPRALALIRRSGMANAHLLIDALQFFRSGATPAELDGLEPRLLPYMQLCDGPRRGPATLEARRIEARTARQLPGEGELPVAELLRVLPPSIPLSLEAPTLRLAGLPFNEQARIAGAATRRFLAGIDARSTEGGD
jgi:sugar phosphate isomerase/epimerase